MLGINAPLGRVIVPEDDRPDAPPVAVISDKYWRARFGSDPAVIGKVVTANNVQVTIVGVLPASFTGIQQPVAEAPDIAFPVVSRPAAHAAAPTALAVESADLRGGCR